MKSLETYTVGDLILERQGHTVTKVTKNGVVLWPQEPHNAGMLTETQMQKLKEVKSAASTLGKYRDQLGGPPETANARQEGGDHYRTMGASGTCPTCKNPVQHWDWAHNLKGLEYAATKYIARWRDKGGLESLKKAIHYLQKLIEIHFPDVAVNISFTNRAEPRGSGVGQTEVGQGLAGSSATYQAAMRGPLETGDTF